MTDARVCQHCGVGIEGKLSHAKFCTTRCKRAARYRRNRCNESWYEAHLQRYRFWRSADLKAARDIERKKRARLKSAEPEKFNAMEVGYRRRRDAARQMQDALAAIPAIMALIANMENANEK